MATQTKTAQQLAEERKRIYQASLAQTTAEAQQQAATQRQDLSRLSRQQGLDYRTALNAAQQSAYQRGNQINQSYGNRGLGQSGLNQYAQIQNQQALGQNVNQLAQQNSQVAQAAMDASRNVGQNLQNTLMRARLSADAQQMDADDQLYAREQQGQEQQFQRALQAMEALGISPDNPQYQQIMQQLFAGQLDPSMQEQLDAAVDAPLDTLGGGVKRKQSDLGKFIGTLQEGLGDFPKWFGINTVNANECRDYFSYGAQKYDIGGNIVKVTSKEDAEQKITQHYANKPFIANGQIKVRVDPASGRVTFIDAITGTESKTYNKAAEKLQS